MSHSEEQIRSTDYVLGYVEQSLATVRTSLNVSGEHLTPVLVALDIGTLTRAIDLINQHRLTIAADREAARKVTATAPVTNLAELVQLSLSLEGPTEEAQGE